MIIRLFLFFALAIFSSQLWSINPQLSDFYQYDASVEISHDQKYLYDERDNLSLDLDKSIRVQKEKTRNGSFLAFFDFGSATKGGAKLGGGGTLDKLSSNEVKRIQNAANRSGKDITVVGSRVNPNKALHSKSDYDFVVNANSKTRNNLSRSLPGAKNVKQGTSGNQDIFKGAVDKSKPHATFKPQK